MHLDTGSVIHLERLKVHYQIKKLIFASCSLETITKSEDLKLLETKLVMNSHQTVADIKSMIEQKARLKNLLKRKPK